MTKLVHSLAAVGARGGVVCIGAFDGVHLGHRLLLGRMHEAAVERGAPAVVVTFFPPARVLFEGSSYLMTPQEKLLALAEFEPDVVASLPFDRELASTEKGAWLAELAELAPSLIVVGEDFRFGRGRAGGLADLREVTGELEAFPLLEVGGEAVKSSRIRALLAGGDVEEAARLLGAPYLVRGAVRAGQKRGREVGFPTANVEVPAGKAVPVGVFAVTASVAGQAYGGMANAGPRPSFPEEPPALEVHLLDFSGDLYGAVLDVRFVRHLRDQRRFAGLGDLRDQLLLDAEAARQALRR